MYFAQDGRAVIQFVGGTQLIASAEDATSIQNQLNEIQRESSFVPRKMGRFYINPKANTYFEKSNNNMVKMHFLGVRDPLELTQAEASMAISWLNQGSPVRTAPPVPINPHGEPRVPVPPPGRDESVPGRFPSTG